VAVKNLNTQMFACFKLGSAELAIAVSSLQEVVNFPDKITSVPLAPAFLLGLFNLRGTVTPIVSMSNLLDVPSENDLNSKIAIVNLNQVHIGLLFDSTSEIIHVPNDDISKFDVPPEGQKTVIRSVIKLEGGDRLIEVIDPEALLKIENIPHILEQARNKVSEIARKTSKRAQCITIRAGSLEFGLHIATIREIIKVPEIKRTVLTIDYCIGMVNLRGTIVPLIDLRLFLKIGDDAVPDKESQRIVILKMAEMHIGFLADTVESIVTFFEEEILPIPMFAQERTDMMQGLLSQPERGNVILLNESKMLSTDEVLAISRGHQSLYADKKAVIDTHKKSTERGTYLSFRLDFPLTTKLGEIEEIAKLSDELMRPPGYPSYVMGMMKMRGEVVTVIDLRTMYGMPGVTDLVNARLLIVKGKGSKFGLLVDSVESIDTVYESQKVRLPTAIIGANAAKQLQGDMKEIVEMTDVSGKKKTYMILDVPEVLKKLEQPAA
jgi:purine-binding chemotaxis protein CheW